MVAEPKKVLLVHNLRDSSIPGGKYSSLPQLPDSTIWTKYQKLLREIQAAPSAGPDLMQRFVEETEFVLGSIYGHMQRGAKMPFFHDFKADVLGFHLNNLHEWAKATLEQALVPISIPCTSSIDISRLKNERISAINVSMANLPLSNYFWENCVAEGMVLLGHDESLNKINFSVLPFLYEEYLKRKQIGHVGSLDGLLPPDSLYERTVESFFNFGEEERIQEKFPRFVSIPGAAIIDNRIAEEIYSFFKRRDIRKVIVKGNACAASGHGGPAGYVILDITVGKNQETASKIAEWHQEITRYQMAFQMGSTIVVQELIATENAASEEVESPRTPQFDVGTMIARKHNVVGHSVWDVGIKYIYSTNVSLLQQTTPQKLEAIDSKGNHLPQGIVINVTPSTSHIGQRKLDSIGKFLNLISPFGAHAMDVVIEKNTGNIYVLEANPSKVRGDHVGTTFFSGVNLFSGYMKWVADLLSGNPESTGKYTQKLFNLSPEERIKYIRALHHT